MTGKRDRQQERPCKREAYPNKCVSGTLLRMKFKPGQKFGLRIMVAYTCNMSTDLSMNIIQGIKRFSLIYDSSNLCTIGCKVHR